MFQALLYANSLEREETMKSYYNLVKITIITFICLCFIFSIAINGEANVSNISASPNPLYPYPPDNGTTTISYSLANSAILWLRIYDLSDNLKRKLVEPPDRINENQTSGSYSYIWNGKDDSATLVPEDYYPYHIDDIAWIGTSSANAYYVYDLVVNPTNSQILWITDSGGRLLKSTDGGITGSQVLSVGTAYGIAISNDGQKIYVLSNSLKRLYYSTNGGTDWYYYPSSKLWSGANSPYDIACSGDGTILYAVDQYYRYVYKSTDSGANWSSVAYLSGTATKLSGVAVDPNNSNIVMVANVGASGSGSTNATVFKSTNGGSTFTTALYLKGTADGSFKSGNGAYQISIDTNGYYWVSDRGNYRIQQFDSNNNWVMTVGGTSYGDTKYKFDSASTNLGIFITSFSGQQYLYVADYKNKKIKRFAYDNHVSFPDPYRRSDLPVSYLVVTTDKVPPDAITNLTTGVVGSDSVQLTWTAPDDAKRYDVRYAETAITTDTEFSAASHVPGASSQGTTEYFTVRGLDSNTTYYFAIKTLDEAFNESDISIPNPCGKTGLLYNWNMVSCPLQPIPGNVFIDDAGWVNIIYYWYSTWNGVDDPDYAGYWGNEYGWKDYQATTVVPGRGILLYSQSTTTPTDADGSLITDPSYNLSLSPGWNMIGNPYGTSVNLSNCYINEMTYELAVTDGLIGNALYIWNGSTYDSFQWDTAKLEPWKGYWIMAYHDLILKINKP